MPGRFIARLIGCCAGGSHSLIACNCLVQLICAEHFSGRVMAVDPFLLAGIVPALKQARRTRAAHAPDG